MRPQQQNRRMRGRNGGGGGNNNNNNNNNNRKGPNPLTRNYESNGPDVKIRGSAQQIAEKYATLARDAQSSGDRVMAENYLQHAEHYNRIIAAAQAQFASQQVQVSRDDLDDDLDDAGFGFEHAGMNGNGEQNAPVQQQAAPAHQPQHQPSQPANGSGPQPVIDGVPAEVALNSETPSQQHGGGRHRDRRHHHRNQMNGNNGYNRNGPAASEQAPSETAASSETAAEQAFQPAAEQAPAPVVAEIAAPVAEAAPAVAPGEPQEAAAAPEEAPAKPRRGRRPRRVAEAEAGETPATGEVAAEG